MKKIKIYLASRIFNQAELEHCVYFTAMLKDYAKQNGKLDLKFFIPGIDTHELEMIAKFSNKNDLFREIADKDFKTLDQCDMLIAMCDGVDVDSGVAAEIGYFLWKKKQPVIKVLTDFRNGDMVNPMLYDPELRHKENDVFVNTLSIFEKAFKDWKINFDEDYSVTDNPDYSFETVSKKIKESYTSLLIEKVYQKLEKIWL